jgi:5-methylcytosine-specific restriction endonuclease McrBC GTP-binding regulatory subunit McrB
MADLYELGIENPKGQAHRPIQRIFFGPPGTGKSHEVHEAFLQGKEGVARDDIIPMCFHPDMASGDFIGRLLPLSTPAGQVRYRFFPGPFLRAVGRAFQTLLMDQQPRTVALVVDEINRGNAPAVFGKVFQLLDREPSGWSSYDVTLSTMEAEALAHEIGLKVRSCDGLPEEYVMEEALSERLPLVNAMLKGERLCLPPNLWLIGTMNTADESIFYLDSAFKRRWTWKYMKNVKPTGTQGDAEFSIGEVTYSWVTFVERLNAKLREQHKRIRNFEDKLVGYWFLKENGGVIDTEEMGDKICFHLWDSVFPRGKDALEEVIGVEKGALASFGDLRDRFDDFVDEVMKDAAAKAEAAE